METVSLKVISAYNLSVADVLTAVESSPEGLSNDEAAARLDRFGPNELVEKRKAPAWVVFLRQFGDLMIMVLIAAAVISGIIGDLTDTIIIFLIILLNAILGFAQEYRSEKAMAALKKLAVTHAAVIRGGTLLTLPSTELVPGDIVEIEAGNVVPADIRLVETHRLRIDESSLTGESAAADKSDRQLTEAHLTLGDRVNIAFSGTLVTNGRGRGIVFATGMATEFGRIATLVQEREGSTPLQQRMTAFGRNLSYIILAICFVLFVVGVFRGEEPFQVLLVSISLAVAAIPEALPALITIALSLGASRLAKQNALVRKLPAVESLGSVTYICTDKTGTLTQNKMRLVELYEHGDADREAELSLFALGMALNHDVKFNELGEPFGEPTEIALVSRMVADISPGKYRKVLEKHARLAELPFDPDRKCMTTVHRFGRRVLIITKGASESVASMLGSSKDRIALKTVTDEWAHRGIRVLAYAYRIADKLPEPFDLETVESDLVLLGVTGLFDPAREEATQAIAECQSAGIRPVMITGDHPATAVTLAKEIGILDGEDLVLNGNELKNLDEEMFLKRVEHVTVYARVSPDQKLRIVKALQQKGHFAAMTGDGVNDAPSLRAANIGIAMGINGTDVSKEAADMVLLDDNFATIVKAVKEGRRIFDNIRKFVRYIMTCNGAEILSIFLPPFLGMPIPLLPVHLLWINLVTDGLPALALAGEKAEPDVMRRPPRPPGESLFAGGIGYHIVWVGSLMAGVTIATQAWSIAHNGENWQTMVFTVLALSQLGHVLAIRSEKTFLYRQGLFTNLPLLGAVVLTLALQLAVIYLPLMNRLFRTHPLSLNELVFCLAMSAIVFHAVEFEKWIKFRIIREKPNQ